MICPAAVHPREYRDAAAKSAFRQKPANGCFDFGSHSHSCRCGVGVLVGGPMWLSLEDSNDVVLIVLG